MHHETERAMRSDEYVFNIFTDDIETLRAFEDDCYIQEGSFVNVWVLPAEYASAELNKKLTNKVLKEYEDCFMDEHYSKGENKDDK